MLSMHMYMYIHMHILLCAVLMISTSCARAEYGLEWAELICLQRPTIEKFSTHWLCFGVAQTPTCRGLEFLDNGQADCLPLHMHVG